MKDEWRVKQTHVRLMQRNLDIIGDRNYVFAYLDAFAWINSQQFVITAKCLTKNRTLRSPHESVRNDIWKLPKAHVTEADRGRERSQSSKRLRSLENKCSY